jgi:hypothetical protein
LLHSSAAAISRRARKKHGRWGSSARQASAIDPLGLQARHAFEQVAGQFGLELQPVLAADLRQRIRYRPSALYCRVRARSSSTSASAVTRAVKAAERRFDVHPSPRAGAVRFFCAGLDN